MTLEEAYEKDAQRSATKGTTPLRDLINEGGSVVLRQDEGAIAAGGAAPYCTAREAAESPVLGLLARRSDVEKGEPYGKAKMGTPHGNVEFMMAEGERDDIDAEADRRVLDAKVKVHAVIEIILSVSTDGSLFPDEDHPDQADN